MNKNDISQQLQELAKGNYEYAVFNKRIVNTKKQVLGVRLPDLRRLAKSLAKNASVVDIEIQLQNIDKNVYEQVFLAGLTINYSKLTEQEQLQLTKKYLELVDSWAGIDSFVERKTKFDQKLWWDFCVGCLKSPQEFVVRYGIIFMMSNFLKTPYIKCVFQELRQVEHSGYYVKMAQAWLYATAAVEFYEQTLAELKNDKLDSWTVKKSYQKMLESYRFSQEQKNTILNLKNTVK